jgi:hypothetical protein
MSGSDTIQRLLDQVEELYVHPRNQENLKKWVPQPKRALDNKWRACADRCGQWPNSNRGEHGAVTEISHFQVQREGVFSQP